MVGHCRAFHVNNLLLDSARGRGFKLNILNISTSPYIQWLNIYLYKHIINIYINSFLGLGLIESYEVCRFKTTIRELH